MNKYSSEKCGKEFTQKEYGKEIKYIDLFCGLGAFHYAFNSLQTEYTRYKCVFACDIDDNVRKIYKANYGIAPEGDINNINIEIQIVLFLS